MKGEILGIIPARGSSKSVPRKNIRLLAGKPLIAYTILEAKKSRYLTRLVVSTEDSEIASVATEWGAEVPFLRPAELARDDTPGIDVIIHAVQKLRTQENYYPQVVVVLQPTSPLRTVEDIDRSIEMLFELDAEAVVSVTPSKKHPYWAKKMVNGRLKDFIPTVEVCTRRQDLPPVYDLNGAVYLAKTDFLLRARSFYGERTYGYVMSEERSLDIDTFFDFYVAELILEKCQQCASTGV